MSARTNLTVRSQAAYPEVGPTTKTFESADVTNGNKVLIEPGLVVLLFNSSVADKTVTYTYDDNAGEVRTKVVTIPAGGIAPAQLERRLGNHAADTAETGYAWLTANGTAGDVKVYVARLKFPLAA